MRGSSLVRRVGVVAVAAFALVVTGGAHAADPPETRITDYVIDYDAASFWFDALPAGGTFECRLDAAAKWTACTSPAQYTALAPGEHTFEVRAVAADGTFDATPANLTWNATTRPTPPAPAPANDNWYGAETISGTSGSVAGSNIGATSQWDEPYNPLRAGHTVWYTWTAGRTANITFSATSSEFAPIVAVYLDGKAEWNNAIAYGAGSATLKVWTGTTYKIAVDGAATGAFTLSWAFESTGPANDYFAEPQELTGGSGTVTGSNVDATVEWNEPLHDGGAGINEGHSIWYRWTSPITGTAFFRTEGSSFDTAMRAYVGAAPHALTGVGWYEADSNPWTTWSRVELSVQAGQTIYLAVDGEDGATGDVTLSWRTAADTGDVTQPTFELISPQPGELVSGEIVFTSDAGDDEAVDRVVYMISPNGSWEAPWYVGEAYEFPYEVRLPTHVLEPGLYSVFAAAYDSSGNSYGWSLDISVEHVPPPTLTVPRTIAAEATGPAGAVVTFQATARDHLGTPVEVSCDPSSGSTFRLGTTVVTCSATDAWSNTVSRSFRVSVVDRTAPALTLPADTAVDAVSPAGAAFEFTATGSDLVSGAVPVSCTPAPGATFAIGDTTVACSAVDAAGNTASGSFVVHVRDALEQVQNLRALVAEINLRKRPDAKFEEQLGDVEKHLVSTHLTAACGGLADFVARAAKESGKRLTTEESQRLVADATRIQAVIPC